MSSSWSTISTIVNGDISYVLKQTNLTNTSVDLILTAYSLKWTEFDIAMDYRLSNLDEWLTDASLTFTTANQIIKNRVYGLIASQYGTDNTIRWQFSDNNISFGTSPQLQFQLVPRFRNFSSSIMGNIVTDLYSDHNVNWIGNSTTNRFVGLNKTGQYMCVSNKLFYILDTITSPAPVYSYSTVLNPLHAIQTDSGNYVIADYGHNRVVEVTPTLSAMVNTYSISTPVFIDYDNNTSSCLITSQNLNIIREVSLDLSTTIWQSVVSLNAPSCATYAKGNVGEIVVCDTGNKRVIVIDRIYATTTTYTGGKMTSAGNQEIPFYLPFRAYKTIDDKLYIAEKSGEVITFATGPSLESSSSSSQSSESSST